MVHWNSKTLELIEKYVSYLTIWLLNEQKTLFVSEHKTTNMDKDVGSHTSDLEEAYTIGSPQENTMKYVN